MAKSFNKRFYEECLEQAQTHLFGSFTVIVGENLYTIYPGIGYNPNFAGFGGRVFRFRDAEGNIVESNNVWLRGCLDNIPKRLVNKFERWTFA